MQQGDNNDFIALLINNNCYTEAYELLKAQPANQVATQYNLALCHFWVENYREAIICLDRAQVLLPAGKPNLATHSFYKAIRAKQNQLSDYMQPITQKHIQLVPVMVTDAIVRLKTDCWLHLKEYAQVIETASPITHKNYLNIAEAIEVARQNI